MKQELTGSSGKRVEQGGCTQFVKNHKSIPTHRRGCIALGSSYRNFCIAGEPGAAWCPSLRNKRIKWVSIVEYNARVKIYMHLLCIYICYYVYMYKWFGERKQKTKRSKIQEKIHSPVLCVSAKDACTLEKCVTCFVVVSVYTIHMNVIISCVLFWIQISGDEGVYFGLQSQAVVYHLRKARQELRTCSRVLPTVKGRSKCTHAHPLLFHSISLLSVDPLLEDATAHSGLGLSLPLPLRQSPQMCPQANSI